MMWFPLRVLEDEAGQPIDLSKKQDVIQASASSLVGVRCSGMRFLCLHVLERFDVLRRCTTSASKYGFVLTSVCVDVTTMCCTLSPEQARLDGPNVLETPGILDFCIDGKLVAGLHCQLNTCHGLFMCIVSDP